MATKSSLVIDGAGYIGSHTALQLLLGGFKVVIVNNLDNSSEIVFHHAKELAAIPVATSSSTDRVSEVTLRVSELSSGFKDQSPLWDFVRSFGLVEGS
ncbi:hypothetical protein Droror1_Dr00020202 [Drosera rotundifolia]